ncbi:UNVERIFIED_CONTAM: hypothetical protein GTU68_015966 [Idotea baltica]|nr:hypothetical protein [Idotea baltica]
MAKEEAFEVDGTVTQKPSPITRFRVNWKRLTRYCARSRPHEKNTYFRNRSRRQSSRGTLSLRFAPRAESSYRER